MSFDIIKLIARMFIILLAIFQVSIIPVSANPIIFGQDHHTGISEIYTYDEIENSVGAEADRTGGLSRVLSVKKARPDHEVLAEIASVAAKTSTQGFKSFSSFKRAMGPAGPGKAWHLIVEQNPAYIAKFGPEAIHNTGNMMKLPKVKPDLAQKYLEKLTELPSITGLSAKTTLHLRKEGKLNLL